MLITLLGLRLLCAQKITLQQTDKGKVTIIQCKCIIIMVYSISAGGIGPAAPVLAGPVFLKAYKSKIPFLQKVSNKQSASVILGLIRLIIVSYHR